jgi:hypothetical protein
VWVGENLAHYYVLSRFLISRMLTVTKVPQMKARSPVESAPTELLKRSYSPPCNIHGCCAALQSRLRSCMRCRKCHACCV